MTAVDAVLALGANLGDRAAVLASAVAALDATDGIAVTAVSEAVETDPVGGPEQPDFLNAVVLVTTTLTPHALLAACHRVEADHGLDRSTKVPWGPRVLDVDVVSCGDLVLADDRLVLPHPRARERAFVLAPWLQVDAAAVLPGPGGGRVADLLAAAPDAAGVRHPEPAVVLR
ncbi:2-amino-4-hydroxy-6-hydroxymethyldihydropteridine diphosphokinase [Kineococcus sp. R8]|uniref:2-amino-4-hydroxy-6- hydroxymethyldihydropteridine diphosphokinase n=1 Tax=Kineococcus siccus TaxID=2696567 RepID=UPI00141256CB|nr:2-amino-4-hydroxy-6-hydroxymethyldihydropteridine diphosphokinase [Kineococcus siccus]